MPNFASQPNSFKESIDMRRVGGVVRLFSMLAIIGMAFTSVAQAAGADRKTARAERDKRVLLAARERSAARERIAVERSVTGKAVQQSSSRATPAAALSRPQSAFVQRLLSAAKFAVSFENTVIAAESRLIANQNRVIRQLSVTSNPNKVNLLQQEGLMLQASIDRDLGFITAIEPPLNDILALLQSFVSAGPGIAAAVDRLEAVASRDAQIAGAIAARPPFTIPPATASM
jgi:hypothetical protein